MDARKQVTLKTTGGDECRGGRGILRLLRTLDDDGVRSHGYDPESVRAACLLYDWTAEDRPAGE